ncbi:MAG: DNA cytosine methyltransferase [Bacteroidales bacterium]|nr:DNA cytosine methyltransferase [Bacteroidales bacterium]
MAELSPSHFRNKVYDPRASPDHSPALRATDYKCPPIATQPGRVEYRIRKITPREAFRLMDVDEENIDRIQNHTWITTTRKGEQKVNRISKTRQYALAGNSIVVACMERIFANLFAPAPRVKAEGDWITLDDLLAQS